MNKQEFNELEFSKGKPSELSDIAFSNAIRQTFNFSKVYFTSKKLAKKKNCSTSIRIERDTKIGDVYVNIRFCVNRPRNEVYEFCRKIRHLPVFLTPLISIVEENDTHSFWKMKILGFNKVVGWNMKITKEIKNQMISWCSAKNSSIVTKGNVIFLDAPEKNTTELRLLFSCNFLFNDLKYQSAMLMKSGFKNLIKRDIKKFKKVIDIYIGENHETRVWI